MHSLQSGAVQGYAIDNGAWNSGPVCPYWVMLLFDVGRVLGSFLSLFGELNSRLSSLMKSLQCGRIVCADIGCVLRVQGLWAKEVWMGLLWVIWL